METLAQSFLTDEEQQRIIRCVKDVETRTSGEIVPYIAAASYDYPRASHMGALLFSTVTAILVSLIAGRNDMWFYLAAFMIGYPIFQRVTDFFPALKRLLVSKAEQQDEVAEAAMVAFYANGLHRTRDMTGILIYVSVFERSVYILADKGINDKVDPAVWDEVVRDITAGIRGGQPADAICKGIKRCGQLVETSFPIKSDDTDELPNLIVEGN